MVTESSINRNYLSSLLSPQSYQFEGINRIPNDRSSKVDVFDTSQALRACDFDSCVEITDQMKSTCFNTK